MYGQEIDGSGNIDKEWKESSFESLSQKKSKERKKEKEEAKERMREKYMGKIAIRR